MTVVMKTAGENQRDGENERWREGRNRNSLGVRGRIDRNEKNTG